MARRLCALLAEIAELAEIAIDIGRMRYTLPMASRPPGSTPAAPPARSVRARGKAGAKSIRANFSEAYAPPSLFIRPRKKSPTAIRPQPQLGELAELAQVNAAVLRVLVDLDRDTALLKKELNEMASFARSVGGRVEQVQAYMKEQEVALRQLLGQEQGQGGVVRAVVRKFQPPASIDAKGGGLSGATARGQAALAGWVADGTLVPTSDFSNGWGLSRQALDQAAARGELFSIKFGNKRLYARALLGLNRADVAKVCLALGKAEPSEMLVFWLRQHGALEGRTAVQAVAQGETERVAELAAAWAEERGLVHEPASAGEVRAFAEAGAGVGRQARAREPSAR